MIKKKILRVVCLTVVFCFTLTFAVFASPQGKLPHGQEKKLARYNFDYNTSANFMKEKGIIKGYGDGDFGFDDCVKRGDITVMIVRAFNINTIINKYVENFEDVEYGSYYYDAIVAAKSFGIAKGNGNKTFNPKSYVTIEEAILLIERSAAVANSNITVEDVDLKDLYDENELDEYATRSDIANMIYYVLTGTEYENTEVNKDGNIDTVEYTIKENTVLTFDDEKLMDEFEDAADGEEFDYVKFTLPSTSYGKLYYDYTSATNYDSLVSATTKFYDDTNPNISDVTFVPKTNHIGTVSINYTAYDKNKNSYEGTIEIVVEQDDVDIEVIKYTIAEDSKVTFDLDDFIDTFEDATDKELNYLKFTLPSSTSGKLYYDYSSSSNYNSIVTENVKYYSDLSKYISKVTFVPDTNYYGTVSIDYTAYDEDGNSYEGIIEVVVEEE